MAPSYALLADYFPPERRGKALGIYSVPVNLGHGVEANVKVWVAPIEEEKAEKTEES